MWSAHLSHELIGDGFQELGLVVLGADEVSGAGSSRLERGRQTSYVKTPCASVKSITTEEFQVEYTKIIQTSVTQMMASK